MFNANKAVLQIVRTIISIGMPSRMITGSVGSATASLVSRPHITTGVIDANIVRIMATGAGYSAIEISGAGIVFYDILGHISIQMSARQETHTSGEWLKPRLILPKPY